MHCYNFNVKLGKAELENLSYKRIELHDYLCFLVAKLCSTLCDSMDHSPPGSSLHGISQARILEWVAFPSPWDLPDPMIQPVSLVLATIFFTSEP